MGLFDEVKQNVTVRQAAEMYGLKPVSYTHLDVYKRQDRQGQRSRRPTIIAFVKTLFNEYHREQCSERRTV